MYYVKGLRSAPKAILARFRGSSEYTNSEREYTFALLGVLAGFLLLASQLQTTSL